MKLTTLLCAVLCLTPTLSCTHLTPIEQQLVDCGSQAVQQQIPALVPQVSSILSSGAVNWQDALNSLLSTAGSAVVCAVEVAVSDLEGPAKSGSAVGAATLVGISRGEAWLTVHAGLVTPAASGAAHK